MIYATCDMQPNTQSDASSQGHVVRGRVNLWQRRDASGPMMAHVKLSGFQVRPAVRRARESIIIPVEVPFDSEQLPSRFEHGFHVHAEGNLTDGCQSTRAHYNPHNKLHGGPMDDERHVGDLGNIRCDEEGEVDAEVTYPKVSLLGDYGIIGRSLVVCVVTSVMLSHGATVIQIHAQPDDYGRNPNSPSSTTTGSAGARIACCVIEQVAVLPALSDSPSLIAPIRGAVGEAQEAK